MLGFNTALFRLFGESSDWVASFRMRKLQLNIKGVMRTDLTWVLIVVSIKKAGLLEGHVGGSTSLFFVLSFSIAKKAMNYW